MGVEPYLIPPVLILSIAQRLTRTFCPDGAKEAPLSVSERRRIESQLSSLPEKYRFKIPEIAFEAVRTPTCPTGLRGRMAVFEVLEMSSEIEKIVLDNPVDSRIWAAARAQGMLTMQEDAMLKAFDKRIPFSEVDSLSTLLLAGDAQQEAPVVEKVPDETTEATTA
jgi:type II secretory ATPase GspE/PulE/Tfp pilus assembly ATPase PilB-like protein